MVPFIICALAVAVSAVPPLNSGRIQVTFGARGVSAIALLPAPPKREAPSSFDSALLAPLWTLDVEGDAFSLSALVGAANTTGKPTTIRSADLADPAIVHSNDTSVAFAYNCSTNVNNLRCEVVYALPFGATSITKTVSVHVAGDVGVGPVVWNVTKVVVFDGIRLSLGGSTPSSTITARSHYGLGDYALFERWGKDKGAILSAQNPYLSIAPAAGKAGGGSSMVGYSPMVAWNLSADAHRSLSTPLAKGLPPVG